MWKVASRSSMAARRFIASAPSMCQAGGASRSQVAAGAAAAAAVSAATAGVVMSKRREERRAAQCEADPALLAAAALGGTLIGAGATYKVMSGKVCCVRERYETFWPRKIMMLFGAPGAGKGTQGPVIEAVLGLPILGTGDMLREAVANKTPVGMKAKAAMDSGALVSDEIVIGIIADRILEPDCSSGFILDGFPRTIEQAKALDAMLAKGGERVNNVMAFDVEEAVLEERICGRWMHKASGRSFHIKFAPPKSMKLDENGKPIPSTMLDDETKEPLYQRSDDTAEALKSRLKSYYGKTVPILDHYRPSGIVKHIDGGKKIAEVTAAVNAGLKK